MRYGEDNIKSIIKGIFMKKYCRTDLACEAATDLHHINGTKYSIEDRDICIIERLDIISEEAEEKLNKKAGRYVTFSTPKLQYLDEEEIEQLSVFIGEEILSAMLHATKQKDLSSDFSVLVIGLGNVKITADAIGPETVDRITVTRHIKDYDLNLFNHLKMCTVSALSPNVLGKTGIESAELIISAVERVSPDAVLVIDALAAKSVERLARTIQISDTGITPGAGIGNSRSEISQKSLGIPVIAIGIPTVVDSAVLAFDLISEAGIFSLPQNIADRLDSIDNFFVTLKETDVIIEKSSILLAKALTRAFVISKG